MWGCRVTLSVGVTRPDTASVYMAPASGCPPADLTPRPEEAGSPRSVAPGADPRLIRLRGEQGLQTPVYSSVPFPIF